MPASAAVQASVSVEDISRKYYESAGYSMWITAMHVDPLELVVSDDASGKFYRVPVELKGEKFEFAEPQEVAIVYKDVKSAAAALPYRWSDRVAALSAQGVADLPAGTTFAPDGTATAPEPTTPEIAPDVTPAGAAIRQMAAKTATKTPDAETPAAGSTTKDEEGSGMAVDPTKLRDALGLAADASDDDVKAALGTLASSTPAAQPAQSDSTPDPSALLAALPKNAGVVVLDEDNYKALLEGVDQGKQALAMARAGERDKVLGEALRDGRFPPAKLSHYQAMWDKNADETRSFIGLLPKNSIPTTLTAGLLGAEFDRSESDMAYEGVYGKAGA